MSGPDALTDLLRRHDRPVAPPAAFADRLEASLLAELGPATSARPVRRPEPVRAQARRHGVSGSTVGRRPRWLDTAAAAVLVIGVMGGMVSQLTVRDDGGRVVDSPGTIAAPDFLSTPTGEELPVMSGGSAARDNRFAGPGLPDGPLTERWSIEVGDAERASVSEAVPYGDMVYAKVWVDDPSRNEIGSFSQRLEARSLSDGTLVWSRPFDDVGGIAVSRAGIVAVVSEEDAETTESVTSTLTMLNLATGAEVWRYLLPDEPVAGELSPVVIGDTVYYADAGATVHALGLDDGEERWVSDDASSPANAPTPFDQFSCAQPVIACGSGAFAVGDGVLYVTNSNAELAALDLGDGSERWTVDVAARFAIRDRASIIPTAVEGGVVVGLAQLVVGTMGVSFQDSRLAFLDTEDGRAVWSTDLDDYADFASVVADGERLYLLSSRIERAPAFVRAYDLATGEARWRTAANLSYPLGMMGDGRLYAWTTNHPPLGGSSLYALDPATGETVETWQLPRGTPSLATASDGTLLLSSDASLTAFRPSSSAASEHAAVMEGGSPARDSQFAGPGPVPGELVERWSAPSPYSVSTAYQAQLLPVGDVVYQLVAGVDGPGDSLFVYSLENGELIRSQPNPAGGRIAVAPAGLLMLLPAEDRTATEPTLRSRLALLDHATGAEIWSYPLVGASRDNLCSPIVDGDTVYVADVDARVYALDLATGAERWVSTETRGTLPETDPCAPAPSGCLTNGFVVGDGTVYVATSAGTLLAIDQADGSLRWEGDLTTSYGIPRQSTVHLAAAPGGVLLNLTGRVGRSTGLVEEGRVIRLDAVSGSQIWSRDVRGQIAFGPRLVVGDERVFLGQVDATGECCSILALDLATGETVWQSEATRIYPLGVIAGELYALGSLTVGDESILYVLDPATGEERWQGRVPGLPNLPLAADRTVLVNRSDRNGAALVALQPVTSSASVASPVASPEATPIAEESRAGGFEADHVVSAGEDVNLRSEPSTAAGGATVIGVVTEGTPLRATGRTAPLDDPDNGPWIQVELEDGTVGWVRVVDVSRTEA